MTEATLMEEFWISDTAEVIEEEYPIVKHPSKEDDSKKHIGHLRGRVVYIGNALHIVVYGEDSIERLYLLRRHYPRILRYLKEVKGVSQEILNDAVFINEEGQKINL